jgi:AcrR family transcriptional regulator
MPDVEDPAIEGRVARVLNQELGQETAWAFARSRALQESWLRRQHPGEGLRERKKRLTRQQISDVATALFVARGFEHVKISEIAELVDISQKTIYNYFPTKESLVFDQADATIAALTSALREREAGESPTKAVLRALREDMHRFEDLPEALHLLMPRFAQMVASTPSLRAAWLDLQSQLITLATEELAARADIDPHDPEPMIAARIHHIEQGLRQTKLQAAVIADLERAARLLDTGLWSFNLLTQGARTRQQLRDAAVAAEEARAQVVDTLKQARRAWHKLRQGASSQG